MNQTYTVKSGDTLYGISNQFGVSVMDLQNINGVNPASLQIGQVLIIPSNQGTNPNSSFTYTVKGGDSLYKIANVYGTTVDQIVKLNNLKNTNLSIGQKLLIPENYPVGDVSLPEYINYTVKQGDTLYKIATSNNVSVDTIKQDNALTSNNLTIGQNLKIRVTDSNVIEECYGEDYTPPTDSEITYTVKRGDSLYSIANKYNTSVNSIVNLNNLKSTNLSIGQMLKIPNNSNSSNTVYTVKSGDNLYAIAREYNTSVDAIKKKNNLTSNNLSIGQKLVI